jgi:hypothetical protein
MDTKIKLSLVTVIYKRPELTDFVLSEYKNIKDRFSDRIDMNLICVGSEGPISHELASKNDFTYIEYPNEPVLFKHNKVVDFCKYQDIDGLVYVGSDDIMDDIFFEKYIQCVNNNIDFFGVSDVYFLTKDKLDYWGGYPIDSPRWGEPIGPGKFFSKKLLDRLNWRPWGNKPLNKGLDGAFYKELNKHEDITKLVQSCKEIGGHLIDIKTDFNISNIKDFNFEETYDISYINKLNFDYTKIKDLLIDNKIL